MNEWLNLMAYDRLAYLTSWLDVSVRVDGGVSTERKMKEHVLRGLKPIDTCLIKSSISLRSLILIPAFSRPC